MPGFVARSGTARWPAMRSSMDVDGGETQPPTWVVAGLAKDDAGDRRPLAVDPANGPEGEAAAGRVRAGRSLGGIRQATSFAACRCGGIRRPSRRGRIFRASRSASRPDRSRSAEALERRSRERVVVVVPGLAEGEPGEPPDVPRSSRESKRRRPQKWQIELMDQVTWWRRKIRTAPPQTTPLMNPYQPPISTQPARRGGRGSDNGREEESCDHTEAAVTDEILCVTGAVGAADARKDPAGVRVPQPLHRLECTANDP